MSGDQRKFSRRGEDLATEHLRGRGWTILDRNFSTRYGELDIVARDGSELVFVEVKAKRSSAFGTAAEMVHREKRRRLVRAALLYLHEHPAGRGSCRFDVVTVEERGGQATIEHLAGAFGLDDLGGGGRSGGFRP